MQLSDAACVYQAMTSAWRIAYLGSLASLAACGATPGESPGEPAPLPAEPTYAPAVIASPPEPAPPPGPRVPQLDCTPVEEVGYRRGRKFPITVLSIDGRLVETETAKAYWAMQLAAADDGVELPIYSGFRSHEEQSYFYDCYKTCSCNSCSPAARPGHSKHQSGSAIDFGQWPGVLSWLKEHGKEFRFYPTVKREPWHWEYRPRRKRKRKRAASSASAAGSFCP